MAVALFCAWGAHHFTSCNGPLAWMTSASGLVAAAQPNSSKVARLRYAIVLKSRKPSGNGITLLRRQGKSREAGAIPALDWGH